MPRFRYILTAVALFIAIIGRLYLATPRDSLEKRGETPSSSGSGQDAAESGEPSAPEGGARRAGSTSPQVADSGARPKNRPEMDLRDPQDREIWVTKLRAQESRAYEEARKIADSEGMPTRETVDGRTFELAAIRNGRVYVRATRNRNAGISTGADLLHQAPHSLKGDSQRVAVWDAGAVRASHREFTGRVNVVDPVGLHFHATHVAGTIGATGINASVVGMAPHAQIDSYDWNSDTAEMTANAMVISGESNKLQLSNHSYGFEAGWGENNTWFGTWGSQESDNFGLYDFFARRLDELTYAAPYYLHFRAAGNDRNDDAPIPGTTITYFDGGSQTKPYDPVTDPFDDGWDNGGYDTIPLEANAKNIITVGAINDAVNGGARDPALATMTSFSSWGPSDDGRIKPDVVANGASLVSVSHSSDTGTLTLSGTSMACPNAMGTAALLVEHFGRRFPGQYMRASTIKGLLAHSADDIGPKGPDYRNGWGLVNGLAGVEHINRHAADTNAYRILEDSVTNSNTTRRYTFLWDRETPLRATICWTDPPGEEKNSLDNRSPSLVHDLDLRILGPGGEVFLPYVLDGTNPAALASMGDNDIDNVEQVVVSNPPSFGEYEVEVSVEGSLQEGEQVFSLLLNGSIQSPAIHHDALENTTNTVDDYIVEAQVLSEQPLHETFPVVLGWNTSGPGTFINTIVMSQVNSNLYRALIPVQPAGTTVYYFFQATTTNGITTLNPSTGMSDPFQFVVVESFILLVSGIPEVGTVSPPYGVTAIPSGVVVNATADLYTAPVGGVRDVNVGWNGNGSVPASGSTNRVTFVMDHTSSLFWQWKDAYHLAQTATVHDAIDDVSWWVESSTGTTVLAAADIELSGSNYMFAGWYVGGTRWPNDTDVAQNPAAGILMDGPKEAVAWYLPEGEDLDGDGVSDWWEYFFLGSTGVALNVDLDDDGFTNLGEYRDRSNPQDGASTPTPPATAHTPLDSPQAVPAPWPISAVVVDNHEVDSVTLEWRLNGGSWQGLPMVLSGEANTYTNVIPGPAVTGDHVDYRIIARDSAGLQSINGTPHMVDIAYPVIMISPTNFGTVYVRTNDTDGAQITIANDGDADLVWSLDEKAPGFCDDVEGGTNGWTHEGQNDVWHISSTRTFSGNKAWYFGRESTLQYPDSAKAWLTSPEIFVPAGATFSFQQWLDTEDLKDPATAWDGAIVELSADGGDNFEQIAPIGGYPYSIYGHPAAAFSNETPCMAGDGGWEYVVFDLSAYEGQTVRLRLHFGSDGFVVSEGWYVDDIKVRPFGGDPQWLSVLATNGVEEPQTSSQFLIAVFGRDIAPAESRDALICVTANDPVAPRVFVPFSVHNPTRIITVQVTGSGAVVPSGTVISELGNDETFNVVADPLHHIDNILTNGSGIGIAPDLASTNITWNDIDFASNITLHAIFRPNRTTNGVTEVWLAEHGLTNGAPETEALIDHDLDDLLTWEEYIAGTDPNNPTSVWRIAALTFLPPDSAHVIQWASVSNRNYRVYCSTNVLEPLILIDPSVSATPPLNVYTSPAGGSVSAVYAVGVELVE